MITMIICSYLNDREEIVGYTDHGIPVHMKEINEHKSVDILIVTCYNMLILKGFTFRFNNEGKTS